MLAYLFVTEFVFVSHNSSIDSWLLLPYIIGCADSYDVSRYRRFIGTNTQINEQRNSTLKVLKSQLSYMNKKNFIDHCKLFMWYRNLKAKKLTLS